MPLCDGFFRNPKRRFAKDFFKIQQEGFFRNTKCRFAMNSGGILLKIMLQPTSLEPRLQSWEGTLQDNEPTLQKW